MRHKMDATFQLALCTILLCGEVSIAKPLLPEDLKDLLPPSPRDKNETIVAVVQDPVIQDAVYNAASNGSLNALVIKKKVFIMPASDPNKVLSKSEHLLVVPKENLEDVRKNITEAKQAESETIESFSLKNLSPFESDTDGYASENYASFDFQEAESGPRATTSDAPPFSEENAGNVTPITDERTIETKFLEGPISSGMVLPEIESKRKTEIPIMAVIDPSNVEKGKVKTPILAILPNQLNQAALHGEVKFLKDNSEKIREKAQNYAEQTLTIDPDYWRPPASSEIILDPSATQGTLAASFSEQEPSNLAPEQVFLAPVVVPRWEIVAPLLPEDGSDYSRGANDMDAAEDIVFRPLFKYRKESQQRTRYSDDGGNRRYGYRPYRDNDYYSRRDYYYRSRYDDY